MQPQTLPADPGEHSGGAARPAQVCSALLAALDAADGRRKMRKRDQTPDRIGLQVKRRLLDAVVSDDPDPDTFEAWLMHYAQHSESTSFPGAVTAMARNVLEEWRLAQVMPHFRTWLEQGAPSDDALPVASTRG